MGPLLFRLRVLLKALRPVQLHPHQAGLVYALVAEANGRALDIDPALPDGMVIEAVELCRTRIAVHEAYAFGMTLIADSTDDARLRCQTLRRGLHLLGQQPPKKGAVLGGNFSLAGIQDLVADRDLHDADAPTPIAVEDVVAEIERLRGLPQLTLKFTAPLRMSVSKQGLKGRRPEHFSRKRFDALLFLKRLRTRAQTVGLLKNAGTAGPAGVPVGMLSPAPHVIENHLVWMEITYGSPQEGNRLGGAVGEVVLGGLAQSDIEALVWGQYLQIGENTRFGHGKYRIVQLGTDPYRCPRGVELRELALTPALLDGAAERYEIEPGRLGGLAGRVRRGEYTPLPTVRVEIRTGTRSRVLSITRREDRALQRAVLDSLAPAIDRLLEPESLAYRKGKGRFQAPPRIRQAVAEGFRWAIRTDFADFFNAVDHRELQRRLDAYIADEPMVDLLMTWIQGGAPEPGRGLPTGAVISPLLANILLDEFDENVRRHGGRLIRYADDFVILFRKEEEAHRLFQAAEAEAEALRLQLNDAKTGLVDLHEPFEFLGFRFFLETEWKKEQTGVPRPIDQLGWHEVEKVSPPASTPVGLRGQTEDQAVAAGVVAILGPGIEWLDLRDNILRCGHRDGEKAVREVPLDRVDQIVAIDFPRLGGALLRRLAQDGKPLILTSGAQELWIENGGLEHPDLIEAQVQCRQDPAWRLEIARSLVIAKLSNYSALAESLGERERAAVVAGQLRDAAHRAGRCETLPQLLGIEGWGAAAWYEGFGRWTPSRFRFPGRRAPRAEDPLNVLLNIGFTVLHRWFTMLLRSQGFAPSLGFLHETRPGHAALASDLQETFRHLVDRAVLEFSETLLPSDYKETDEGPYRLHVHHAVQKRFRATLHRQWSLFCQPMFQATSRSYLTLMTGQTRALRLHLLDRAVPFIPFIHPDSPGVGQ